MEAKAWAKVDEDVDDPLPLPLHMDEDGGNNRHSTDNCAGLVCSVFYYSNFLIEMLMLNTTPND